MQIKKENTKAHYAPSDNKTLTEEDKTFLNALKNAEYRKQIIKLLSEVKK